MAYVIENCATVRIECSPYSDRKMDALGTEAMDRIATRTQGRPARVAGADIEAVRDFIAVSPYTTAAEVYLTGARYSQVDVNDGKSIVVTEEVLNSLSGTEFATWPWEKLARPPRLVDLIFAKFARRESHRHSER
jgi:hypothetical protein